jgi:hypothetical protein
VALSGTIQDFGVADIFQLIGQQAKTGRLRLSNGRETVIVMFRQGLIAHAENESPPRDRLFGQLLVRADVITPSQLERALEEQQRTLERLGSVLRGLGLLDEPTASEFARLQMTETLYGLFSWTRGTYEFEAADIDASADGVEPVRAEHVVMNGIRMADEWPSIREQIPSYTWMVEPMRPLPPPGDDDLDLPLAFDQTPGPHVGENERRLYRLLGPGRSVQKLIDIARLGEFETCRALSELMGEGYVRVVKPRPPEPPGPTLRQRALRAALVLGRIAVSAAVVLFAGVVLARGLAERRAPREIWLEDRAVERRLEAAHRRVVERALEIYRLRHGAYPPSLDALVAERLLDEGDLSFPYARRYDYAPLGDRFRLVTPLD